MADLIKLTPNALGLFRLFSVPVLIWLILEGHYVAGFWLFLIAGLSDALDGYLARKLGVAGGFGEILDPIADKALMNACYLTAAAAGLIPWWMAGLVAARDFVILLVAVATHLFKLGIELLPLAVGKANTFFQVSFAALVLAIAGYGWQVAALREVMLYVTAALTVISGTLYAAAWVKKLAEARRKARAGKAAEERG